MNRPLARQCPLALTLACLLCGILVLAPRGLPAAEAVRTIPVELGDYTFVPDRITVQRGETVRLELANTDFLTPHNFSIEDTQAGLDVDVDIGAGETTTIEITPRAPGTFTFFCDKQLLFFKSHREHGMEGTLVVTPDNPD